ncbi:MAG: prolipoprotein diacylglyceryl transferase [Deltaproteobacteria bacterium]|nr:prolipoprotein diacylglyceryl transferase [Deltaproteobacteria bacterium]
MSVLTAAVALPFLKPPPPIDIGVPIQVFGMIVAAGVLIGAALLRRYAEWHGVTDEQIRGLTGWITVAGFIGAHEFDVIAYQWDRISEPWDIWPVSHWPLPIRFWDGISSYGGFIGGAVGFAIYVWWKRLPVRLFADIAIVGLLPAFSIGRIGCTVVSDHIGAAVDTTKWYAALAMDYPRSLNMAHLAEHYPGTSEYIRAWNLGLIEFLYLVPVNAFLLWLAFRPKKRPNAGLIAVAAGLLYSPVRFFLDFLRPEETDPRHLGLTFAQWASILAFGVAAYVAARILKGGAPAEVVAPTSGDAQRRIKMVLKEQAEAEEKQKASATPASQNKSPSKPDADDDHPSEAEDKAASADATEGDEGVDDLGPAPGAPKARPPSGGAGNRGPGAGKNKRKR